jgi:Endonuclease/Exonuclease/phosphatase family
MQQKIFTLLFFILGFIFNTINAQTTSVVPVAAPMAITFYNMENFYDTIDDPTINDEDFLPTGAYNYTGEVYRQKLKNLEEVVSKLGTERNPEGFAILGTAEIENESVLKDLCKMPKLKNRNLKVIEFPSPDARGIDVAMLYNPKMFKLLGAEALYVDIPNDEGSGKARTRDVLMVCGKLNGEKVYVFVNHWPSRRGGEAASAPRRKIAAGVSRKAMDSILAVEPEAKCVVMGDLNDDPINESMTKVLRCKAKPGDVGVTEMYNPWVDFYKKGLGTMAYNDAWSLFDQIVLSHNFVGKKTTGLHFVAAEVFNKPWLIEKFGQYKGYPKRSFSGSVWNNGYSDHFATILYLQ